MADAKDEIKMTDEAAMGIALGAAIGSLIADVDPAIGGAALAVALAEWLPRLSPTTKGQERALNVLLAATARHMEAKQ